MNTKRTLQAVTDEAGQFEAIFEPYYSESGYYTINSGRVGNNSTAIHDEFNIPGMMLVSSDYIIRFATVDSVTHDTTWIEDNSLEANCFCRSEFELTIPSKFIGTQYASFERENYTINYRRRE